MKTSSFRAPLLALVGLACTRLWTMAGELPQGPPAPTMVSLQLIYDRPVPGVPKTGQTGCFDASGASTACAGTGQDGEFRAGVSVEVRFTDNLDGTIRDTLTGLIWLKDANCYGQRVWQDALVATLALADGACGLADGSQPGDWSLPNVEQLQSLIDFGQSAPALPPGHEAVFAGVASTTYWSSTSRVQAPGTAWSVQLDDGAVQGRAKSESHGVWPVRRSGDEP